MFRIDNASSTDTLPTPAAVGPNPDGFFGSGTADQETYVLPTKVDFDWLNAVQEELCYFIEESGATLDKTDNTQFRVAIQYFIDQGGSIGIGIPDVEADTAPELGGNLIVNGHKITSVDHIILNTQDLDIQIAAFAVSDKISHYSNGAGAYILFGTDTIDLVNGGTIQINNSGFSLNASVITSILDEDDFSSDSATATFTQQSGKAYVDTAAEIVERYYSAYILWDDDGALYFRPNADSSTPRGVICGSSLNMPIAFPRDATISHLRLVFPGSWNTATTDPVVATLYKNGSSTALTVTIGNTNGAQDQTDTTHTVSVSQGDLLDVMLTTTETSTINLKFLDVSFKYV